MIIFLIISIVLNFVLAYASWNSLRNIEQLEEAVNNFYSQLSITLNTMRALDEKQMFEKDDEVGEVFGQLIDTVNDLRPLIYGSINTDGTKKDSAG